MIINSYNVNMGASRKSASIYSKETEETRKNSGVTTKSYSRDVLTISDEAREYLAKGRYKSESADVNNIYEKGYFQAADEDVADSKNKETENSAGGISEISPSASSANTPSIACDDYRSMQLELLLRLLEAFTKNKNFKKLNYLGTDIFEDMKNLSYSLKKLKGMNLTGADSGSSGFSGNNSVWNVEKKESVFIKEEEVTAFSSTGMVKTADGRDISFNVTVEMSRSFEDYFENYTHEAVVLRDPLVINLDSAPANISDQTFLFDIDADGIKDEISQLGKGSGFLALDKNNDGIINNGNELFGALTGNGFNELSMYDKDGNGWIDEADEIYNKLRVWTKDEKGKDVLLTLKEADLGAIYLGNVATDFSVNDVKTNEQRAQVRNTGVYLKESGGSGSIQQIDFAVKNK